MSCNSWIADTVAGETTSGNDTVLSAVGTGGTAEISHTVEITMPQAMTEALNGSDLTWFFLSNGNIVSKVPAVKISSGVTYYSHSLTGPTGPTRIELRIHYSELYPVVMPDRTVHADIKHSYKLASGPIISATAPTLYITSVENTVDSITFPERIDLGIINVGDNTSEIPIDYQIKTHILPVYFKESLSSDNSRATVDGTVISDSIPYQAPFRLGLKLDSNSVSGTYTSTITESWTCP